MELCKWNVLGEQTVAESMRAEGSESSWSDIMFIYVGASPDNLPGLDRVWAEYVDKFHIEGWMHTGAICFSIQIAIIHYDSTLNLYLGQKSEKYTHCF